MARGQETDRAKRLATVPKDLEGKVNGHEMVVRVWERKANGGRIVLGERETDSGGQHLKGC